MGVAHGLSSNMKGLLPFVMTVGFLDMDRVFAPHRNLPSLINVDLG